MKIEKVVFDKLADAVLETASDCFDLAKTQRLLVEEQHTMAARQQANADRQQAIATEQHADANKLESKAEELNALGRTLVDKAAVIKGEALVQQPGS